MKNPTKVEAIRALLEEEIQADRKIKVTKIALQLEAGIFDAIKELTEGKRDKIDRRASKLLKSADLVVNTFITDSEQLHDALKQDATSLLADIEKISGVEMDEQFIGISNHYSKLSKKLRSTLGWVNGWNENLKEKIVPDFLAIIHKNINKKVK